jgi:hypothetical protein
LKEISMKQIALMNDVFRRTFTGGRVTMTAAVDALSIEVKTTALIAVQQFNHFTEGNDPHEEHDFGSFELAGEKFLWKIDYYDETCTYESKDPCDEDVTTRVLTLMLASDY